MLPQRNTMLCNACTGLLSVVKTHPPGTWTGIRPALFESAELPSTWAGSHHIKEDEFLEAAQRRCYICSTIYRDASAELRKQAHAFRTFYHLRAVGTSPSLPHLYGSYELEFTTEILNVEKPIAEQQVFDCSGIFKILPKKGKASPSRSPRTRLLTDLTRDIHFGRTACVNIENLLGQVSGASSAMA